MTDKNYVNHEVQALKGLYKEGQKTNDQHKFQDELQKIVSGHPGELKAVVQGLQKAGEHHNRNRDNFDSHLPQVEFHTGTGKNNGKIVQINVSEQNRFGETGGRHDHAFLVNGKQVEENKTISKELNDRHNISFNADNEIADMTHKNQAKVDIEAAKGNLVWKEASNGKLYPLNPESSSHVLTESKEPAEKPFSDNCHAWGRTDAMKRWTNFITGNENIIEKAISVSERIYQAGRID